MPTAARVRVDGPVDGHLWTAFLRHLGGRSLSPRERLPDAGAKDPLDYANAAVFVNERVRSFGVVDPRCGT